jgi:hypothetical protein
VQERVTGVLAISTSSSISHQGIVLVATGNLKPHFSASSGGLFEAFSSTIKPIEFARVRASLLCMFCIACCRNPCGGLSASVASRRVTSRWS